MFKLSNFKVFIGLTAALLVLVLAVRYFNPLWNFDLLSYVLGVASLGIIGIMRYLNGD